MSDLLRRGITVNMNLLETEEVLSCSDTLIYSTCAYFEFQFENFESFRTNCELIRQ